MPAAISHYLLAQKVYNALKEDVEIEKDAFFWGTQGPDFFFTHRIFPWQRGESFKKYGGKLHSAPPSETLGKMREYLQRHPQDKTARDYVLGFLCHYAFDSTAHPFVNCGARLLHEQLERSTIGTCHNEIEASLDTILLRYETAQLPSEIRLTSLIPKNQAVIDAMARLYHEVILGVFSKDIPEAAIRQASLDCRTAFSLQTDRTGLKRQLIARLERKKAPRATSHIIPLTEEGDYDWANILCGEWQWPMDSDEVHTESFFELYEQAVLLSQRLIKGFLDGEDLFLMTRDKPFA